MGGPTCVGNAGRTFDRAFDAETAETGVDASDSLAHFQSGLAQDADAGAIVAPVLEAPQAFEEDGWAGTPTDVTNNAAHDG